MSNSPCDLKINKATIKSDNAPHEQKVAIVIKTLYFFVFFMKIELKIAPIVPSNIRLTADNEIKTSLKPNGLTRKLELDPNIRKVP